MKNNNRRITRAVVQVLATLFVILICANAAYLAAVASQTEEPGIVLSTMDSLGLFPLSSDAGTVSIEDYCPFGPIEGMIRFGKTLWSGGISFVGPVTLRNLGVLLAILGLVLVTKKTFCSWLCPFGALFDLIGAMGSKMRLPRWKPGAALDRKLRLGRYVLLVAVICLTGWTGTLIFKEIDPFFAVYSAGYQVQPVGAYVTLGILLVGALFLPGIWCHYLCPVGGFLDPFSRLGRIRLARDSGKCSSCQLCSSRCPQKIEIHSRERITDARCTNCLDCVDACPRSGALELRLEAEL